VSQHRVPIVDSHGNPGRLKMSRVRVHEAAENGRFVDGVFVFKQYRPATQVADSSAQSPPVRHTLNLAERLSELSDWPAYNGPRDGRSFTPMGFLTYPQPSMKSLGQRFPGLAAFRR
jgi:hypothetical protein